jgi:hypothetical protein
MSLASRIRKSIKKRPSAIRAVLNPPSQYSQMMQRGDDYRQALKGRKKK